MWTATISRSTPRDRRNLHRSRLLVHVVKIVRQSCGYHCPVSDSDIRRDRTRERRRVHRRAIRWGIGFGCAVWLAVSKPRGRSSVLNTLTSNEGVDGQSGSETGGRFRRYDSHNKPGSDAPGFIIAQFIALALGVSPGPAIT